MNVLKLICSFPPTRKLLRRSFRPAQKEVSVFGLRFSNAIGLAAGFDKNAKYLRELSCLGFGHVEIGTVTPKPQEGNPKPRLFRLPKDRALVNRMGFNNEGVQRITERLKKWRSSSFGKTSSLIVGGNIGKNKLTPNEEAWQDYVHCFSELHPYVDYFVVNVSSPNTPGLRELQEKQALMKIFTELQQLNNKLPKPRPILLKIAPDLNTEQLSDVVELAMEIRLDGLVISNTTIARDGLLSSAERLRAIGAGGLSGKPVQRRSSEILEYIHQQTRGKLPLIASGGIFTAEDAKEKIEKGAVLVQVWTGFIYEGPAIVKRICKTF